MKRRALIVGIFVAGAALAVLIIGAVPRSPQPEAARFIGLTNGVVGPIATTYGALTTNAAKAIQQWFSSGTNAAMFSVTNQQSCPIWLLPIGRFYTRGPHPRNDQTPVLNASSWSGIYLQAGEVTNVQVAFFPHQGPCRVSLLYTRDSCQDSFLNKLKTLPSALRARIDGTPVLMENHTIFSDWIAP